jgi:hypothetical protein
VQLSPASTSLINAVAAANPNTVVVLNTANPVLTPWLPNVKGVIDFWFAGQEGGTAMARVLLGLANPSGHSALTWPANATDTIWGYNETIPLYPGDTPGQHPERLNGNGGCTVITGSGATCPPATQTTESEGIYTGYRFFDEQGITPQFPFGFGLSYTTFGFSNLRAKGAADGGVDVTFTVTNTGKTAGADAAQVYVGPPSDSPAGIQFAVRSLAQFDRVFLEPGASKTETLHISPRQLSYWDESAQQWVLDPAGRKLSVGDADASASLPLSTTLGPPPANITCSNEQINATTIHGNLTVPQGAWCDLVHVTVAGNLQLHQPAGVRIQSVKVNGNLQAESTTGASDPLSATANVICDSSVSGNLAVTGSAGGSPWNIGGCGANTVSGNLQFRNNAGNANTVANNAVSGNLDCQGNGTITGTGNLVQGTVRGQCTGSRP